MSNLLCTVYGSCFPESIHDPGILLLLDVVAQVALHLDLCATHVYVPCIVWICAIYRMHNAM